MTSTEPTQARDLDFARQAGRKQSGFLGEFWAFLLANRKWWLMPIAVTLLLLGILVAVGGTAAAPFIYTLF